MQTIIIASVYIALSIWLGYKLFKHLPSDNVNSDAVKQINAIKQFTKWYTPSLIHKITEEKARMKDVGLMSVALFGNLFQNGSNFFPLVSTVWLYHIFSSILLYQIGSQLWSFTTAVLVSILYLINVWPLQVVLMSGYQLIGQFYFLLSIYLHLFFKQDTSNQFINFLSGVAFAIIFYTSASSRKYVVPFGLFLMYTNRNKLINLQGFINSPLLPSTYLALFAFVLLIIYYREKILTSSLKFWINFRQNSSDELNIKDKVRILKFPLEIVALFMVFLIYTSLTTSTFRSIFITSFLSGITIIFIFFNYPNFIFNIWMYSSYASISNFGHFLLYKDYLDRLKITIYDGWRVSLSGIRWIYFYLRQTQPFLLIILLYLFFASILEAHLLASAVIFYCFLPAIWGEITKGPQIGRSYFPMFITTLFGVGELTHQSDIKYSFYIICILTILSALHSIILIAKDLYPTRIAVFRLHNYLKKINANMFYTYQTAFNESLVSVLLDEYPNQYTVNYISELSYVPMKAIVVIPSRNCKGLNVESSKEAISGKSAFLEDVSKNQDLIKYSIIHRIPTVASSKLWLHESEVTSLRYLIIKDISDSDFDDGDALVLRIMKP